MSELSTRNIQETQEFQTFLQIIRRLRDPNGGCPWDIEQTFTSLGPQIIEEAYEVAEAAKIAAAKKGDVTTRDDNVAEELGDLLSVIALYIQIGEDERKFSYSDVFQKINEKLIRRHPHVFGDENVSGTDEVLKNWEAIKQQERTAKGSKKKEGILSGLPLSMPALLKAHRIGEKCARVNFDWSNPEDVVIKVQEEVGEFLECVTNPELSHKRNEEFGDLLFSLAQLGRHLGINTEEALQNGNQKFMRRFSQVEELVETRYPDTGFNGRNLQELDLLWDEVKRRESAVNLDTPD
jgi:ATP diphosphatase